ncbi:MAG TPA: L,D-transpeptidase family protein [Bradyrhizobium sp.]|nr:L,D-transpeptidase family protein [Bradyrhizobium sp.]
MTLRECVRLTRRSVITLLGLGLGLCAGQSISVSRATAEDAGSDDFQSFQPGQFSWHPERSPQGPVAIIVSIPKQLTFVYRNGILIGVSTSSTGKPGHSTPTGVFTILEKAKTHTSATYDEPMPDMERLTWKGIALHVGDLLGYPDSHGCVHLPQDFADGPLPHPADRHAGHHRRRA